MRLDVSDTGGRYYVLLFVDAWTNNFAYVGHRATGTKAALFLLVPPGYERNAGDDWPAIRFPTEVGTIVGRWAVDGEDDLSRVKALQAALSLTPLVDGARGLPNPNPAVAEELRFFEQMRVWIQAFPPAARARSRTAGISPITSSTTTSTSSNSGRSRTRSGSSTSNLVTVISGGQARHAAVSGETTDTKPPMQWCMRTPTETS